MFCVCVCVCREALPTLTVWRRLREWRAGGEGAIRLSVDDGPPAREFLDDGEDEL